MSRVAPSTKCSCSRSSSSGRLRGRSETSEQHALNGITSPSAAGSPPRSVRKRIRQRRRPGTDVGAPCAGCCRGRALASSYRPRSSLGTSLHARQGVGGHPYPAGGRHPGDGHRCGHRSAQTGHPDDGSRLSQHARYHAARIGRARRVQPETIGLHAGRGSEHPLGSRRGLFIYHGFCWRTFEGVPPPLFGVSR